jgi:hypothetical protein
MLWTEDDWLANLGCVIFDHADYIGSDPGIALVWLDIDLPQLDAVFGLMRLNLG